MKKVSVIIVAGGSGSRMGCSVPKQFLTLEGKVWGGMDTAAAAPLPVPFDGAQDAYGGETADGNRVPATGSVAQERKVNSGDSPYSCVGRYGKGTGENLETGQTPPGRRSDAGSSADTERSKRIPGSHTLRESAAPDDKETQRSRDASLENAPILEITLRRFMAALPGCEIVVVLPDGEISRWKRVCDARGLEGTHRICPGGKTRFDSVRNGIRMLGRCDYIAVHDGVRPLVTSELILQCVATAGRHGSGIPAVRPVDSFRIAEGSTNRIIDRNLLRAVQTPQVFRADLLIGAYDTGYDPAFTDDASVVEASGVSVTLCEGDRENIKITTREDLAIAKAILGERAKIYEE